MVLDLICVLIIVIGVVIGYVKGLFKMVAKLVSIALAFFVAISVAGPASTFVYQAVVAPGLEGVIVEKIDETGAEELVTGIYDTVSSIQSSLEGNEIVENIGNTVGDIGEDIGGAIDNIGLGEAPQELSDIYNQFNGLLEGLSPTITNFIATEIDLEQFSDIKSKIDEFGISETPENQEQPSTGTSLDDVGGSTDNKPLTSEGIAHSIVNALGTPIIGFIHPIAFALLFFITSIVATLLLNFIVALLEKISITEKISAFGGAGVGAICALAIALAVAALASAFITPANELFGLVEGSIATQIIPSLNVNTLDMIKII